MVNTSHLLLVCAGVLLASDAVLGQGGQQSSCRYTAWKYDLCNPTTGMMQKSRIAISTGTCTRTTGEEECNLDCVMAFHDWPAVPTCSGGFYSRTQYVAVPKVHNGTACPAPLTEQLPCKVDCVMTFAAWSPCDKVTGLQTRIEKMTTPPQAGGKACPAAQIETRTCPVDCEMKYPAWDPALHVCNKATGQRTRTQIAVYEAKNGGAACNPQTEPQDCAVDCELSYPAWSTIPSSTCDKQTGLISRTQNKILEQHGGDECPDPETEYKKCPVNCEITMGPMSACDKTTGNKKSMEYISVQPKNGGVACRPLTFVSEPCAVDCEMKFPSWDPLVHQCDKATGQRVRYEEVVTLPNALGVQCPLTPKKEVMDCPVNCEMKLPEWSAAQHLCDPATGLQTRTQIVSFNAKNGGSVCPPPQSDSRKCVVDCKLEFPDWESVTCNKVTGIKTATQYQVAAPKNGGAACPAAQTRTQPCLVDVEFKFPDWDPTVHLCNKVTGLRTRTEVVAIEGKNGGRVSVNVPANELRADVVACAVDCELKWPAWSADLHPCDKNTGLRTRKQVSSVLAQNGGRNCPIPAEETVKCPVDCETGFPDWNSIPCQTSNTKARAQIPIVATKNGGKTCVFQNPEVQLCQYISGIGGNTNTNFFNNNNNNNFNFNNNGWP